MPDYQAGTVVVVDARTGTVLGRPRIEPTGAHFQLLAYHGFVWFSDTRSNLAGIVTLQGAIGVSTAGGDRNGKKLEFGHSSKAPTPIQGNADHGPNGNRDSAPRCDPEPARRLVGNAGASIAGGQPAPAPGPPPTTKPTAAAVRTVRTSPAALGSAPVPPPLPLPHRNPPHRPPRRPSRRRPLPMHPNPGVAGKAITFTDTHAGSAYRHRLDVHRR